jgi:hypothetical protein
MKPEGEDDLERYSMGRSPAKDITPTIKYEALPRHATLSIIDGVLPEILRSLPIPGHNAVVYRIVQDGRF